MKKQILIVDDNAENIYLLNALLQGHGYGVVTAAHGEEALQKARQSRPDLIISDILMPVMDGFALCRAWKQDAGLKRVPFIFYTATYTDDRDREFALSLGAERFVVKPAEPDLFMGIIQEVLQQFGAGPAGPAAALPRASKKAAEETVYLKQYNETIIRKLEHKMEQLEQVNRKLEQNIAERKRAEAGLQQSYGKLQKLIDETIEALGKMGEMRDPYTAGHQSRVARLAMAIAGGMGVLEKEMMVTGLLHDVGKIIVPVEILTKPGKLTEVEFQMIQPHSQAGYDILYGVEFPWPVALTVLQHHERMNGSGYPNRLAGNQIIMEARILAVADVVEAMASHRPYRPALGIDNALEEISRHRGILYDPVAVDACLKVFREGFKFE